MDVRTLRLDEISSAAPLIARAFRDDALTVYLFPDEGERSRLTPLMFNALVRYDCLFGQVDYLDGFTAVAAWMRPGETAVTPERLSAAGFDELPDEIPLERLDTFFTAIAPLHERAIHGPHWYLRLLGVDPSEQGRGLGAALLQHGLRRADAGGNPCYLETFSERNLPFYRRNGFELVVDNVEPTSGIRTWGFLRSP